MKYKFTNIDDVFNDNPELKLVEEYRYLSEREMSFVLLVGDPASPFVNYYNEDRDELMMRKKAAIALKLGDSLKDMSPKVKALVLRENDKVEAAISLLRYETGFKVLDNINSVLNIQEKLQEYANTPLSEIELEDDRTKHIREIRAIISSGTFSKCVEEIKRMKGLMAMTDHDVVGIGEKKADESVDDPKPEPKLLDVN